MKRGKLAQPALDTLNQSSLSKKKAQQEMVGFVLIVVLVIVGLMVYLVFQLRDPPEIVDNKKIGDVLSVLRKYTTDCEKNNYYLDMEGLIQECYRNGQCTELGMSACEYMEEQLEETMNSVWQTEAIYSGYRFNITVTESDGTGIDILYGEQKGNCTGLSEGALERIELSGGEGINLMLRLCKEPQTNTN